NTYHLAFDTLFKNIVTSAIHNVGESFEKPRCDTDARGDILKEITDWLESPSPCLPIFWLHGMKSVGKSAILQSVADRFHPNLLIASFFFAKNSPGRNDHKRFIPTIAYQLAQAIPKTKAHILDIVQKDPSIFEQSLSSQARQLIIAPLTRVCETLADVPTQYPHLIVVDGLNECTNSKAQCEILRVLKSIISGSPLPLKFLIACRADPAIKAEFDDNLLLMTRSFVMHERKDPIKLVTIPL
ncbi:hypothetical protein B0H34DRAFT_669354, partial [Crassisporium funariophilum]